MIRLLKINLFFSEICDIIYQLYMSYAINSFQQIHLYNGHKDSLFSKFYKYIFIRKIKKQIKGINKMPTLEKKLNVCHWHILTIRGNFDNFFTHHCRRWNIINWQMSTVQYYSLYMQVKIFLTFLFVYPLHIYSIKYGYLSVYRFKNSEWLCSACKKCFWCFSCQTHYAKHVYC